MDYMISQKVKHEKVDVGTADEPSQTSAGLATRTDLQVQPKQEPGKNQLWGKPLH